MANTRVNVTPASNVGSEVRVAPRPAASEVLVGGGGGQEVEISGGGGNALPISGTPSGQQYFSEVAPTTYAEPQAAWGVGEQTSIPQAEVTAQEASPIQGMRAQAEAALTGFMPQVTPVQQMPSPVIHGAATAQRPPQQRQATVGVEEPVQERQPLGTEIADAQRFAAEDAPLPNASTRRDPFSAQDIAAARERDRLANADSITEMSPVTPASVEDTEEARSLSAMMGSTMSRSVTDSPRVKPSIFDRLMGRTPRRQAQLSSDNMPTHRPSEVIGNIRDKISSRFGRKGVGTHIYGKMVPLPTLGFREVGVGMQEIAAVIEQNPDMLDDLIRASLSEEQLIGFTSTRSMLIGEVADLVNSNEVDVFTAKPPNNRGQDVQRRKLRILESEQRGIYLHPIMAAMYTADFDGDDMLVSLDPSLFNNAKDPMAQMVGIDGEQSLDMSFLPVSQVLDGYEDGKTARDYVREVMLAEWSGRIDETTRLAFNRLVDSVMALSDTALKGSDDQAAAYGEVFRSARALADLMAGSERASDRMMSRLTEAVYQGMRNLRVNNALATMGEVVPRDFLPPAYTGSDNALYNLVDGMVLGAIPNNFQELKVMMNGFLGNVGGKSAPFRFTADVGKMVKLDKRLRVGDEYVVDPDKTEDMVDFLQATVKFAYSQRMASEVKTAGKSFYFTEVLRNNVIREVGFPEQYDTMLDFVRRFAWSYNRNAAMINEANLVWLTNMGIDGKSNRKTVSPIRNSGNPSYRDISSPFVDVYGSYGFDRLFGGRIDYEAVDPQSVRGGGTNKLERDWYRTNGGRRWIKSRYREMSIRAFSVGNHIVMEDREKGKYVDVPVGSARSDADVTDGLILAIADKRTSTSSTFNIDVMGRYDSRDGKRGKLSTIARGGRQTVVSMMSDELRDIRTLDLEGTMLMPGYYAGIGSREAPPEVRAAMTELARQLADKGWQLRSGHAEGADQAFEMGAGANADIYLPFGNFQSEVPVNGRVHVFDSMSQDAKDAAEDSVNRYHPAGKNLRKGRSTHRRNYFQVVGIDGAPDSAFVACYAPGDGGGTGQAIRIARDRGIPVFNAADYDDLGKWIEDVKEAARKSMEGQLFRQSTFDQMIHVDDAVMALNASGYEMFRELNMDSTAGFLTSEYGRKLVEHADDVDVIAGIRAAMVFAWQTRGVTRLADQLRELENVEEAHEERYMDLKNQAVFAVDELMAKSIVWRGIVSEMRARPAESAFANLRTVEGRLGLHWKAVDFWTSDNGYSSIRQVIEDLDMPWTLKCDVITDVVRWQTQDYQVNNFEVAFQMEVGGDSRFSLGGDGKKSSMRVYKDAESASRRYADRSARNLREEVRRAAEVHRDKQGVLRETIHRLATSPWEIVHVEDTVYADAILAVRDKVYAQSEKAQKHPSTNFAYSALTLQRNGGYFNDVYRFDDRMLGLQHKSQLSAMDLARILDDPDFQVTVYDDYGSIGYVDQFTLLNIDHPASEQEIWDFLVENPRLACMLRSSAACVTTEAKNRGYLGAWMSLEQTLSAYGNGGRDIMGNVKYLMRDHPVYAGLISLLNPAHGTSTRNERNRVPKVEEAVCRELYRAAVQDGDMGAGRVLSNLGVTRLKLRTLLTSDYDKYMASMGLNWDRESIGEAKAEADDIYDTLERHIASYIAEIRREVPYDQSFVRDGDEDKPDFMGMDIESVASFWDAVQELSGSKVGVSTGIEGSETYRLSYWVSHMGAKDHYANLEAIAELIEDSDDPMSFDGMWTNKGTLSVRIDEDGSVTTNIDELREAKSWEGDEVITRVPDGFDVPDRSTDSYGKPVPSLYVSMVSKRSNGAEKFNLKAMKAGLDGTDSVTKMRDKYLTVGYGDRRRYPTLFFQVREELGAIASEQGIDAARMELARRMMEQDHDMGYNDMTLANYMSIAEVMLIEDAEGGVILRSIEQLTAAVRGRIGARAEEMGDREVSAEIARIISDTSEQGVGRSMVWDTREMLTEMRPHRAAGDAMSSVRISSSVFKRNYDLLMEIQRKTGIEPLDAGARKDLHEDIVGKGADSGIPGIKEVWGRSNVLREYQVIGYVGDNGGNSWLQARNIGPSTAIIVGDGPVNASQVADVCDQAYESGTTVIVSKESISSVPSRYVADMIPISDEGDMMIPMFDARLNGSEAKPFEPRFAIFKVPFSRYVISVEDRFNVFELGDAQYKFTRALVSRLRAHDNGNRTFDAMQLFPNVFANEAYKDARMSVSLASKDVVQSLICDPESPQCTIDYGLVEGASGFGQQVHDVNAAIRRFKERINLSDDQDSVLRGVDGVAPGDIVAWADMTIEMDGVPAQHVLAPIIPFPLHGANRVPESFKVLQVGPVNNDGSQFCVDWAYDRSFFEGDYAKYFDSSGGANKGMINLSGIIEDTMRLKNGMDVDAYCAAASTDSRKIGTDRRIKTMISLMAIARMQGYNFARSDGAFPNDPELRDALSSSRLPRDFWSARYEAQGYSENPITFCHDRQLNAFIERECRKVWEDGGNPSDFLATSFRDSDGVDHNEHVMWEFECMFDNSLSYEDALLRFLHMMDPGLCPNGIDDATEETTFRLYREGKDDLGAGYDRGMLQMQVPYPMSDGRVSYVWSNVFVGMSFFGEEFSKNSRPNVRGASDMLDAENTNSYYGVSLSKDKSRDRAAWATSGEGRPAMDSGAIGLE